MGTKVYINIFVIIFVHLEHILHRMYKCNNFSLWFLKLYFKLVLFGTVLEEFFFELHWMLLYSIQNEWDQKFDIFIIGMCGKLLLDFHIYFLAFHGIKVLQQPFFNTK